MPTTAPAERIAIVGVGGIFPGAPDLDTFWNNVANGVDSGRHVPDGRWYLSPEKAYAPWPPQADRVYSTWGCFIEGFTLDPAGLNLNRELLTRLDPMFHLGLHAARAAFRDARQLGDVDRSRVGVILGNIALPTESTSAMCRDVLGRTFVEKLIDAALESRAESRESRAKEEWSASLKAALRRAAPPTNLLASSGSCPSTLDSRLSWHPFNRFAAGLPASLIAQGLDLGGTAYTLDAACASSLYALKFASEELLAHRADAMLAGGMSRPDCQYTQMGFAQLQALSRRGRCAPLSAEADGLVVGEGAGVFVLKRLSDAIAAGDHIYGVIAGIGLSNDRGANLLAPHSEGQLRAMRSAYEQAGWKPSDVDLIECHATGTPVGDAVEIESLHQLWQRESAAPHQCVIGGVKSNVGHLLTGAGAAGLMKVLFALKHHTLPPTANYSRPAEKLAAPDSPFRVLAQAAPWPARNKGPGARDQEQIPRRATINAFGFGGINAHVLIEEWQESRVEGRESRARGAGTAASGPVPESRPSTLDSPIAIVGLAAHVGDSDSLSSFQQSLFSGRCVSSSSPETSWGVEQTEWYRREIGFAAEPAACEAIREVKLPLGRFRIPPVEMQDMLPQQQLMLKVAAEALWDAEQSRVESRESRARKDAGLVTSPALDSRLSTLDSSRIGVFIGIELDPNTTNFHLRWSIEQDAARWAEMLGLELSPDDLADWIEQLKAAVGPPLSANRVMGNLGGIVASRLAREFDVGGPSFTISANENSGLRALELAAHSLQRGELDQALVGAVDLPCDVRSAVESLRATGSISGDTKSDGSLALVLKRLDDAVRDGDRIHAVIGKVDNGGGCHVVPPISCVIPCEAATSLAYFVQAVLSVRDQIQLEPAPHFWLHDRRPGPRGMAVPGFGLDGRTLLIDLQAAPPAPVATYGKAVPPSNPWLAASLFVVDGDSPDELVIGLEQLAARIDSSISAERLARRWLGERPPRTERRFAITFVVQQADELAEAIRAGLARLSGGPAKALDRRVFFSREPLGQSGRLAFVFPGSGNAFPGMGREILATFPDVLRQQETENERLRSQFRPDLIWHGDAAAALLEDHKAMIFGQVAIGTAICDLLARFGVRPSASIGYSLGESAALFSLRAWTDRDEMLHRMEQSPLFGSDLVAPFDAARKAWGVPEREDVPWLSGVIDRSREEVRTMIAGRERVYLLIVNTPAQCVIGGERSQVERLVRDLDATFVPLAAPSTVHCEVLRQVEAAYRELHRMRTAPPNGIDFYSVAWGRRYELTRESAAEAIVAQAVGTIDFPRVIERAYADGVRLFVEIGPGSSCTKMIDEILGDRPHLARAALPATSRPVETFLELLAVLIAERVPVDLSYLYGQGARDEGQGASKSSAREIVTRVGGLPFEIPAPPGGWRVRDVRQSPEPVSADSVFSTTTSSLVPRHSSLVTPLLDQLQLMTDQRTQAHETFLRFSARAERLAAEHLAVLAQVGQAEAKGTEGTNGTDVPKKPNRTEGTVPPRSLTREQCMTFAIGKIGDVLGQKFAEIDRHPTRVRLPDEPLMLVDRILAIEGEPLSMTSGRVVTEHDIHPGAWYLDCGRIPTCIAVESGQADLFLSGWLGIDFETKGLACYRLLDAVVTFHDALPPAGKTIHYDIRVLHFFRQGQTYLFRFEFDATVDGRPLLTMREGCAGFFTEAELAGGKGIVHTALDKQPRPGQRPADWSDPVPMAVERYDDSQLLALRRGDLAACFGPAFGGLSLREPVTIPGVERSDERKVTSDEKDRQKSDERKVTSDEKDRQKSDERKVASDEKDRQKSHERKVTSDEKDRLRLSSLPLVTRHSPLVTSRSRMWLIDRVLKLDPVGGKFGMGTILGELDIHPDDWFLTCHFCDDQVMPGTLMYECCLHTLRIYLLRMGWIGERDAVVYEPIPGVRSRLKCRGQVLASTKKVWYEVTLKEIGYGESIDHPPSVSSLALDSRLSTLDSAYCLADALMYADGKPIVEITDMSVRLTGLTREKVERLWEKSRAERRESRAEAQTARSSLALGSRLSTFDRPYDRRPAIFDTDRITAFAIGRPSEAFGDRYRVFDEERKIARLPGPPFQFLDRIVSIQDCEQWKLQAGGEIVAQYDVPPDAWYFAANRQPTMPFAVLLETALQPCGWLAAYLGSALTSETDLSFRNLGGQAIQYREVTPQSGTLTTRVRITKVSQSGGMIIQNFDYHLSAGGEPVYVGDTYFGFFSKASLANQVGIRDASIFVPSPEESSRASRFDSPDTPPFANAEFQMVDNAELRLDGGPHGLGFVRGTMRVDPRAWFFKAHFYQDPVVPGSLGLESFFQLMKFYAAARWRLGPDARFQTPSQRLDARTSKPVPHEWVYRGQVIPRDELVTVTAVMTSVDDSARQLTAEGFLSVDGRVIYQMKMFTLSVT